MYKIKMLIRHLVLVIMLPVEGAAACKAFLLSILQEISEGGLE